MVVYMDRAAIYKDSLEACRCSLDGAHLRHLIDVKT